MQEIRPPNQKPCNFFTHKLIFKPNFLVFPWENNEVYPEFRKNRLFQDRRSKQGLCHTERILGVITAQNDTKTAWRCIKKHQSIKIFL